ncbi:4Fe-4S dicluster domain protein [Neomoorella glycerini]|uniref:Ferredoxin n=1 Tax=Neomoorella glycerini TaxID=55779 RepID=A0A6I5ZWQ8_9FIRM|nr:4Fe-4S dicluster domain-containing protein [Moorella glycerini]QGP93761.1 4Fe-4S dicluster domain protein [Moorella glycerini]
MKSGRDEARFYTGRGVGELDLETIASALTGLGQVRLRAEKCIRTLSPWATCQRCLEVCPVDGIELQNGRPGLKECRRCGLCAVACPTGALEDPEHTHAFILARGQEIIAATGQVIFSCARGEDERLPQGLFVVPCLGAVAPEIMVALAARGQTGFRYRPEDCAACPWGEKGQELFKNSFSWAQRTLATLELPHDRLVQGANLNPATAPKRPVSQASHAATAAMGRREFFRSLVRGIKVPGVKVATPAPGPGTKQAVFPGERMSILREALQQVRPETGYPARARLPLASLELAGPCYLCNICSRLCPAGALDLAEGKLRFTPARCNHCGLCLAVCPQHSLTWGENLAIETVASKVTFNLATAGEHLCANCGETFQASAGATECLRCYLNRKLAGPGQKPAGENC